jgi:hypothetical protein
MIRAEKDKEVIKKFNSSQKNIYYSWKERQNKKRVLTKEEILNKEKFALEFFKSLCK